MQARRWVGRRWHAKTSMCCIPVCYRPAPRHAMQCAHRRKLGPRAPPAAVTKSRPASRPARRLRTQDRLRRTVLARVLAVADSHSPMCNAVSDARSVTGEAFTSSLRPASCSWRWAVGKKFRVSPGSRGKLESCQGPAIYQSDSPLGMATAT